MVTYGTATFVACVVLVILGGLWVQALGGNPSNSVANAIVFTFCAIEILGAVSACIAVVGGLGWAWNQPRPFWPLLLAAGFFLLVAGFMTKIVLIAVVADWLPDSMIVVGWFAAVIGAFGWGIRRLLSG